jgi:hypothetical protein
LVSWLLLSLRRQGRLVNSSPDTSAGKSDLVNIFQERATSVVGRVALESSSSSGPEYIRDSRMSGAVPVAPSHPPSVAPLTGGWLRNRDVECVAHAGWRAFSSVRPC